MLSRITTPGKHLGGSNFCRWALARDLNSKLELQIFLPL